MVPPLQIGREDEWKVAVRLPFQSMLHLAGIRLLIMCLSSRSPPVGRAPFPPMLLRRLPWFPVTRAVITPITLAAIVAQCLLLPEPRP